MRAIKSTLVLLCVLSNAHSQTVLYVSPNGIGISFSVQAPGNLSDLANKLKQTDPKGGSLSVYLKQGFYTLYSPLNITNESIGGKYSNLLISSAPGQRATICGGKRILGWKLWKDGIYKAPISVGLDTRQLYFNGKPAIRSRMPDQSNNKDLGPYYRIKRFDKVNKTVVINLSDANDFVHWDNLKNIEMVMNLHHYQVRIRIKKMVINGNEIIVTPREPEGDRLFIKDEHSYLADGKTYYFENALAFLNQDNEWYADTLSNIIYYKPASGSISQNDSLIVPIAKSLIKIAGTVNSPLSNIEIKNLNLAYTTWLMPSQIGLISAQGVWLELLSRRYHIPGVIDMKFGTHILIKNCKIFNAGGIGIVYEKAIKNSLIIDNHLFNIAANGVMIDTYTIKQGNLPDSTKCTDDTLTNNLFENMGSNYTNGEALVASCVSGLIFQHNEISNLRYTGLQIGNFFGDELSGVNDNIIRFNNIHDVLLLHDDGGAIYVLGNQPGTKIYENYLHNIKKSKWADPFPISAIYLDAHSAYMEIKDNLIEDIKNTLTLEIQSGYHAQAHDNKVDHFQTDNRAVINNAGIKP